MYVGTKIGFNLAKKFISVVPCNLLNLIRALRSVHFARRTVHEGTKQRCTLHVAGVSGLSVLYRRPFVFFTDSESYIVVDYRIPPTAPRASSGGFREGARGKRARPSETCARRRQCCISYY